MREMDPPNRSAGDDGEEEVPVTVCVRLRPRPDGLPTAAGDGPARVLAAADGSRRRFDRVFSAPDDSQEAVFAGSVGGFLQVVLDGYDLTALCLGQSGAGKTHTLFGPRPPPAAREADFGAVPRFLRDVFAELRRRRASTPGFAFSARVSFAVVENGGGGLVTDLIVDAEDVEVSRVSAHECRDVDEAFARLSAGLGTQRRRAEVSRPEDGCNAVFTFHLTQWQPDPARGCYKVVTSTVKFVELAGCDRHENSGLLWLLAVVNHDSPRTALRNLSSVGGNALADELRDSLEGRTLLLLLCCISPLQRDSEFTDMALRMAESVAQKISSRPRFRHSEVPIQQQGLNPTPPNPPGNIDLYPPASSLSNRSSSVSLPPPPPPAPFIPHLNPQLVYYTEFLKHYAMLQGAAAAATLSPPQNAFPLLDNQQLPTPPQVHLSSTLSSRTSSPLTSPLPMRPAFAPHLYVPSIDPASLNNPSKEDMAALPISVSSRESQPSAEPLEKVAHPQQKVSDRERAAAARSLENRLDSILEESETSSESRLLPAPPNEHQDEGSGSEESDSETVDDDDFDSECSDVSNLSELPNGVDGDVAGDGSAVRVTEEMFSEFCRDTEEIVRRFEEGLRFNLVRDQGCDDTREHLQVEQISEALQKRDATDKSASLTRSSLSKTSVPSDFIQLKPFRQLREKVTSRREELKRQEKLIERAQQLSFSDPVVQLEAMLAHDSQKLYQTAICGRTKERTEEKDLAFLRDLLKVCEKAIVTLDSTNPQLEEDRTRLHNRRAELRRQKTAIAESIKVLDLKQVLSEDTEGLYDPVLSQDHADPASSKQSALSWLVPALETCVAEGGKMDALTSLVDGCMEMLQRRDVDDPLSLVPGRFAFLADELPTVLESLSRRQLSAVTARAVADAAELFGQGALKDDEVRVLREVEKQFRVERHKRKQAVRVEEQRRKEVESLERENRQLREKCQRASKKMELLLEFYRKHKHCQAGADAEPGGDARQQPHGRRPDEGPTIEVAADRRHRHRRADRVATDAKVECKKNKLIVRK